MFSVVDFPKQFPIPSTLRHKETLKEEEEIGRREEEEGGKRKGKNAKGTSFHYKSFRIQK